MPKGYPMEPLVKSIGAAITGRQPCGMALEWGGAFGGSPIASYVSSIASPPGTRNGVTFVNKTPADGAGAV
jgi:hypothetical protein